MLCSQVVKQSLNDGMSLSADIFFWKNSITLEYKWHDEMLLLWTCYNLLIYYALKVKSKNTL